MSNAFDYRGWVEAVETFISQRASIAGFDGELDIAAPLTEGQLGSLRSSLHVELPESVACFLSLASSACRFKYTMDLSKASPEQCDALGWDGDEILGGADLCVAESLEELLEECKAWATETWIAEEDGERELWMTSLPIVDVGNGDKVGVLLNGDADPPVVYLSHDDASQTISSTFTSFLETWRRLCFFDLDVPLLDEFSDPKTNLLSSDSEKAQTLRSIFRWE